MNVATLHVTDRDGGEHVLEENTGGRVMEALRNIGCVPAICGGTCTCSTCHVYVDGEWYDRLPTKRIDEDEILSVLSHWQANSRLSCQIELTESLSGLRLTVAPLE
jgi:2Fe-2S ferredoxin